MKLRLTLLLTAVALLFSPVLNAADPSPSAASDLEAKFKATMADCTMSGRTTALKGGELGASKDDKYSIVSAEKVSGNSWVINARMRGIVIPVPVKMEWAGDCAVMIVDNLQIPGAGNYGGTAYSARVMVYGNTYSGTWSGGDHGGILAGVVTKNPASSPGAK